MAKWFGLLALMSYYLVSNPEIVASKSKNDIIAQVNQKGPYLGLVSVYQPEEDAFFSTGAFKPDSANPFLDFSGRRLRFGSIAGKRVIYVRCGEGLINAATTTQQLIDLFDIRGIIHFGIAGNLDDTLSIADVTIPSAFVNTGIWDWLNSDGTPDSSDIAGLDVKDYNAPKEGENLLGHIGFNFERLYSVSGEPNTPQELVWAPVNQNWLNVAKKLEGVSLDQCVNASLCLPEEPKLVVGHKGSSANIFVDNAAFRDFLYNTFQVSSTDMESSAVVMTSLSNGYPVIVIRGLANLAGKQAVETDYSTFEPLAALNTARTVIRFVHALPPYADHEYY